MIPRSVLFTGGCRSGKSGLAQRWAERMGTHRAYVATARGFSATVADAELHDRVLRHRAVRGDSWVTVEPDEVSPDGPLDAALALRLAADRADVILFDCVTLWLSDWLLREDESAVLRQLDALAAAVVDLAVPVALVTNELGSGLVPDNALGRRFRDMAGLANQRLGDVCEAVVLAVCGQPVPVKGPGIERPVWLGA